MEYLISALFAVVAVAVAFYLGSRRLLRHRRRSLLRPEQFGLLRQIDQLILDGVAVPSLAQQVLDRLPEAGPFLGGAIRTTGDRGVLTILGVSRQLKRLDGPSLDKLPGVTQRAETLDRAGSLTVQAINQRRQVAGTDLSKFDCPPLTAEQANRIQVDLGIKGIVVYPIEVDQSILGALTFYLNRPVNRLPASDRELMESVAKDLGVAMSKAKLVRQLEEIDHRLAEANQHLKAMDAVKDEFISVASHQLRSPLTAVKGYLSMLEEGDYGRLPAAQRPIIRQLASGTNQAINLINEMLSVSRITARRFDLSLMPISLSDLVSEVAEELRPLATQKDLGLEVQLPTNAMPPVLLDGQRMRQVIINFVDNAIKYSHQGTVRISLTAEQGEVVFAVTDSGIGIPSDEMHQLGEKFFRASNARRIQVTGSGLGLFVAKRVIEEHGGQMVVESKEGTGSTFGFRLPQNTAPQAARRRPAAIKAI